MSIPEAAQLILQAGALGEGGEIFVLDMGDPVLVKDIAIELIKLSGYTPEIYIPINYIGLRPGEKMFEELITTGEGISESPHKKIMILKNDISHGWNVILGQAENLITKAKSFNVNIIKKSLKELLPEYDSSVVSDNIPVNSADIKKQI